jgi:enoyl-CoA hydratase/carnithine racemase
MDNYKFWQVNVEDNILWARIHRPDKKNAINQPVIEEYLQILQKAEKDPSLRALIISSISDEIFCSGADIEWFAQLGEPEGRNASTVAQNIFGRAETLPIPVIAAVKGLCLTAGFELMLACDIIICADNAKLGQIETKYGLTPGGGGTQRLTRLVGPIKSREMIYTAKIISAAEALSIGLINSVVPLADLDKSVKDFCNQMAKNSPRAIKEAKILIRQAFYVNEKGFNSESIKFGEEFGSGEPRQRFEKFLAKSKDTK